MIQRLALGFVAALLGASACTTTTTNARDANDSSDAGLVCKQTLTRVRCAGSCEGTAGEQTFAEDSTTGTCGGNAQVGCLVERVTGDFYSSPTTSYFAEVTDKFRSCTPAEEEALRAPADAGSDAGLVCKLTLTRVRCAEPCDVVARERTFSEASKSGTCGGNLAEGCLVERSTGDFYSSPTTSYFDDVLSALRECTATEREGRDAADGG